MTTCAKNATRARFAIANGLAPCSSNGCGTFKNATLKNAKCACAKTTSCTKTTTANNRNTQTLTVQITMVLAVYAW